jgi:hypothetical protein
MDAGDHHRRLRSQRPPEVVQLPFYLSRLHVGVTESCQRRGRTPHQQIPHDSPGILEKASSAVAMTMRIDKAGADNATVRLHNVLGASVEILFFRVCRVHRFNFPVRHYNMGMQQFSIGQYRPAIPDYDPFGRSL